MQEIQTERERLAALETRVEQLVQKVDDHADDIEEIRQRLSNLEFFLWEDK